jgi:nucleotide-binding universal stress UspA family protein
VIALDGSVLAERSLRPALALAEAEAAEVTLLRIVPEDANIPEGEMVASIGPARARDVQDAQWYLSSIRILLTHRRIKTNAKVMIASDIPAAILDFAQSRNADLIAIATHGRGGIKRAMIGSVADSLLSDGVISVLAIHPEESPVPSLVAASRPMFAEATA